MDVEKKQVMLVAIFPSDETRVKMIFRQISGVLATIDQ
jgi:hypothetical protein